MNKSVADFRGFHVKPKILAAVVFICRFHICAVFR
jgi:hypothetical protein